VAESCKAISTPLTFEKVEATLQNCNIVRVEELLPLLPPDFRSRYVLAHNSRSLQGATGIAPRVIMFGLDAKFIIAFSGSAKLAGYDSIETIEFDDESKKFNFRSISFPAENRASQEQIKPYISEKNPERCTHCHRKELRPNWDTYSAWPGIFGSKDDGMPAAENAAYLKFRENVYLKEGRYRYFEDSKKYPDQSRYFDYLPYTRRNLQFTFLLSLLNGQAIAREIKENPKLYPFRYALLSSLRCDDDFNDPAVLAQLIPSSITSKFTKTYGEISEEVTSGIEASYRYREDRQYNILIELGNGLPIADWEHQFKPLELGLAASNTSRLRYIMELAGVPFPEWSLELGSKNYVFFAGEVGEVGELGLFLWQELLDPVADPELYHIYKDAWDNRNDRAIMAFCCDMCDLLRKKSLAALAEQ
jgi:hypothetical protein